MIPLLLLAAARQPREPHHCAQLQNILFPRHRLVLLPEFLGKGLAALNILGADEVGGHFDAIGEVADLSKHSMSPMNNE